MECNNKNVAKRVRNRKKRIQTLIKKKEKVQKEKDTVAECFEKKSKQPLIELSMTESKKIENNNLHLTNYCRTYFPNKCKGIYQTFFDIKRIGTHIKKEFNKQNNNSYLFNLQSIKNNYITITVDINDEMRNDDSLHIISNGNTGKALLLVAIINKDPINKTSIDNNTINIFKKYRYNIASQTSTTSHFGSTGYIYGTGLVAQYNIDRKLSFAEYANKNREGCRTDELLMNTTIDVCMKNAFASLKKIISEIDKWCFLISGVVRDKICSDKSNIPPTMTENDIPIYLSAQLNINAKTKYSHTEKDSSYTIIHVPNQDEKKHEFYFYFQIKQNKELRLRMINEMSMTYSSYLLTHSQRSNQTGNEELKDKSTFVNISSYFSKRLFSNIATSYHR